MKLHWRVKPAPTGPYSSFERRGWPDATYADDRVAVALTCDDAYVPAKVRAGAHSPIRIRIAFWFERPGQTPSFEWRMLKAPAATLTEAKHRAEEFVTTRFDEVIPAAVRRK